ncbi:MAG TPA: ArsR family transcriptional regulator, partial [Pseudorhizobium sp.]|nr:ArsR family transcriptional regulator [Pseudorhizobium sp.]
LRPGGRLLIVDLAPHNLEYLRDEHAHVRLGFSHQIVSEWLEKMGLEVQDVVDLTAAEKTAPSLTATVWLARDRRLLLADTHSVDELTVA